MTFVREYEYRWSAFGRMRQEKAKEKAEEEKKKAKRK